MLDQVDNFEYKIHSNNVEDYFYVYTPKYSTDVYMENIEEFLYYLKDENYSGGNAVTQLLITGMLNPLINSYDTYAQLAIDLQSNKVVYGRSYYVNCSYTTSAYPVGVIFRETIDIGYGLLYAQVENNYPTVDIDWINKFPTERFVLATLSHELGHQLGLAHHSAYSQTEYGYCAMNIQFHPYDTELPKPNELIKYLEQCIFPICICNDCASHVCDKSIYQYQ